MSKMPGSGFRCTPPNSPVNRTESSFRAASKYTGGFTLLEVMAAMVILSFVLVAVYRMQTQTINMSAAARFYSLAPLLAQSKMSDLELMTVDDLAGESGDFGETFPNWAWNVDVEDVESEYLGTYAENLKRIDVSVSFNDEEFTYGFRTYRLMEEDDD